MNPKKQNKIYVIIIYVRMSTFLGELHLDDVLEVLEVGIKFHFYKIEIDKCYWKIHSKITMIAYFKF